MFRLIVDVRGASIFAALGPAKTLAGSDLEIFQGESPSIEGPLRQQILEQNQAGRTCLAIPTRPWRAVFFDMDSTVIAEESIVELARVAGKEAAVHAITEDAMAGRIDFETALRQRVAMLQGLPASIIQEVAAKLSINPGMREFAKQARQQSVQLYLVSGGFHSLAKGIANELGFQGFLANELEIHQDSLSGKIQGPVIDAAAKARFLLKTCEKFGFSPELAVAVGDGANDLPMMQEAGAAIGYHPKPVLLPYINGANFHDHRVLVQALL